MTLSDCHFLLCTYVLQNDNHYSVIKHLHWASQVALAVKNLPANAGGTGDVGSTPGPERPPEGGNGNLLQYSFLENSMDRGAW